MFENSGWMYPLSQLCIFSIKFSHAPFILLPTKSSEFAIYFLLLLICTYSFKIFTLVVHILCFSISLRGDIQWHLLVPLNIIFWWNLSIMIQAILFCLFLNHAKLSSGLTPSSVFQGPLLVVFREPIEYWE